MNSLNRQASKRNLQLDFFRGLALMIIFINHLPDNPWGYLMPSRLGPSDAAETFVFLSGYAAAIAYGRSFKEAGIGLGTVQILFRCAQIYIAHLGLFMLTTSLFLMMSTFGLNDDWQLNNLHYFFDHTQESLLALVSLEYLPNFIDILPMYMVILLWIPIVWSLSRIHNLLAVAFSLALYLAAWIFEWELTADPVTGRHWYFNPFCWQLIFFTGFAFSSGWLPIPRSNRILMWACLFFIFFCLPLGDSSCYHLPWFKALQEMWAPLLDKSHLGFIRYLHFLVMTYLVSHFMRHRQNWLNTWPAQNVISMGQQSLPIFMVGTGLSLMGGMLLNTANGSVWMSTWINLAGLGLMILLAQCLNWLEKKPWKVNAGNTRQTATIEWPTRVMQAFCLVFLTITPLLLLQSPPEPINMAKSSGHDLAPPSSEDTPQHQNTEETAFQKHTLESPDTL